MPWFGGDVHLPNHANITYLTLTLTTSAFQLDTLSTEFLNCDDGYGCNALIPRYVPTNNNIIVTTAVGEPMPTVVMISALMNLNVQTSVTFLFQNAHCNVVAPSCPLDFLSTLAIIPPPESRHSLRCLL